VALVRERRGAYVVLVGKPERWRPLSKPKHKWEGNINMNLSEVGYGLWTESIWLMLRAGGGLL